jgi:hypothetical protein
MEQIQIGNISPLPAAAIFEWDEGTQTYTGEGTMKTVLRWLVVVGIIFQFLPPSAYAGWKNIVADNEKRAAEYISLLKAGADPGSIERPSMRHADKFQAKKQQRRFYQAMDRAEELARAGRHEQITELEIGWENFYETESKPKRKRSGY